MFSELKFAIKALLHTVISPLQVSIHVVQNRHIRTQKSHWGKTNERHA